jgi:hypothetical protein
VPEAAESVEHESLVEEAASPEVDFDEVLPQLVGYILFQLMLTGGVLVIAAGFYGATARDFGLPSSAAELFRDVRIGVVAWLAAILPVHGTQMLVMLVLGLKEEETRHPLVEMIMPEGAEPGGRLLLFLLASIVAVIVAPLSEEVFFRLMLQGWLEKWQAWWAGRRDEGGAQTEPRLGTETVEGNDECLMTNDECRTCGKAAAG